MHPNEYEHSPEDPTSSAEGYNGSTEVTLPTQVKHPRKATLRTAFAVLVPAVLGLLVLAPPVATVLQDWALENPNLVGAEVAAAFTMFAAWTTALSTLITRILAVPGVELWLQRYASWLAADSVK